MNSNRPSSFLLTSLPQHLQWYLHLQGPQTGPSRHWNFQQGHAYHELICQRYLRANRHRSFQACHVQQKINHFLPRNPNSCPSDPARLTLETRNLRRNKGCHQIHIIEVVHNYCHFLHLL
ncbi:hypothetical protein H4Q26_005391 [Puccinia striiformis f. sp. tritici PST-130]|nr:hypothetical protein H4Q26_005391 [Puccinia striiformis f. sp. tritici PST-130]